MNDGADSQRTFRVEGLRKSFDIGGTQIDVLKGIDIEFKPGGMLSIVGSSGAGKSTFLHVLGTLEAPTAGRIVYGGADITALDPKALARFRNRTIGFVFQSHHLLPDFTAIENCAMPARIAGMGEAECEARAAEILGKVGLGGRLRHKPGELSGGEQQRVAVARALVMRPSLLLADEPTGNLDTVSSESVHDLLLSLNELFGLTVIVVTHNERLASRMPRVLTMADGVLTERAA